MIKHNSKKILVICSSPLHLFQASIIRDIPIDAHFLLDTKLRNHFYANLLKNKEFVSFNDYKFLIYEKRVMKKIRSMENDFIEKIGSDTYNEVYMSHPCDSICTLVYNLLISRKLDTRFVFFDDGLFTARLTPVYLKLKSRLYVYLKQFFKSSLRMYYFFIYNYEFLWSAHPDTYINSKKINQIVFLPELYQDKKYNIIPLRSVLSLEKLRLLFNEWGDEKRDQVYYFLSYYSDLSKIDNNRQDNIIYVGHPKITYSQNYIQKGVPSELVALTKNCIIQPSSLVLVSFFGKKYMSMDNNCTLEKGGRLISALKSRAVDIGNINNHS